MIIEELYYIFEDALKDRKAIETKTSKVHSVIANGIKIQKFSDRIEILNMGKGGDYFKECSLEEYDFFYEDGWIIGCYRVKLNNCLHKLKIIEEKIKTEVNTRKNDKHIQNLKSRRESILKKYTINKNKLNQIKSKYE
jgi:hypothetical protein